MKYLKVLFSILFIMLGADSYSQSKSQNIEIYAKVWGFIKYHHPNVAGGTINWDSVFVAHIDKIIVAKASAYWLCRNWFYFVLHLYTNKNCGTCDAGLFTILNYFNINY